MKIGVLAMQGAYKEHMKMLKSLNVDDIKCNNQGKIIEIINPVEVVEIRNKEDLKNIDGLIIPGGESTTMGKLIKTLDLYDILKEKIESGLPIWGTCAGMILLAKNIYNDDTRYLATMDIEVMRNAYGRQLGSFHTKSLVNGIGDDVEMVFIRAPYIKSVGENVQVLSTVDENIVAARQDNMLVTSFHPELTGDNRVHKYFINMIK